MFRAISKAMLSLIFVFGATASVSAYDNDTHYWLTYYLSIKAGFTPMQAEQIASANVSVDFDDDTEPVLPDLDSLLAVYRFKAVFSVVRSKYHALPSVADINAVTKPKVIYWWNPEVVEDARDQAVMRDLVLKRQDEFWAETIAAKKNPGMFLHYLQDTFAHRNFRSFFGHAGYRRVDHLSTDRAKSWEMVQSTLRYLIAYRTNTLQKTAVDPSKIDLTKHLSSSQLAEIRAVLEEFCDVNPSIGREENAITRKWRTLEEDSKTDYSTPSGYLISSIREAYQTNTAPDSRRAREVVIDRLKLDRSKLPQIWLYDYSQAGVAKRFTSHARIYGDYKTPIKPEHDFPAKSESENTKRMRMKDDSRERRKLCMPFVLVDATTSKPKPCS